MATLSERLIQLDQEQAKLVRDKPTSIVYPTRSGTKDIHVKSGFNIGGNFKNIKKVARQPLQIYKGEEYLKNVNKNRHTIKAQIVNPTTNPKIINQDIKPSMTMGVEKVYGMIKMGGAGVKHAAGQIMKLEEIKLIKMAFLSEDV